MYFLLIFKFYQLVELFKKTKQNIADRTTDFYKLDMVFGWSFVTSPPEYLISNQTWDY